VRDANDPPAPRRFTGVFTNVNLLVSNRQKHSTAKHVRQIRSTAKNIQPPNTFAKSVQPPKTFNRQNRSTAKHVRQIRSTAKNIQPPKSFNRQTRSPNPFNPAPFRASHLCSYRFPEKISNLVKARKIRKNSPKFTNFPQSFIKLPILLRNTNQPADRLLSFART
jgi:hypothetical protein